MKTLTNSLRDIGFLTIALTLALVANYAYGQWANPTVAPTGGNVSLPVNTSTITQTKLGNFGAVNLFSAATSSAGSAMHSPLYCDQNGDNCWNPGTGAPTGGSGWDYVGSGVRPQHGTTLVFDTGLGAVPSDIKVDLVNVSSQGGYTPGDVIHDLGSPSTVYSDRWHNFGVVIYTDGTDEVKVRISPRGMRFVHKTAPTYEFEVTPANWEVRVSAKGGSATPVTNNGQSCNSFGCTSPGSSGVCTAYGCP